jgi:hypothetical protein
MSEGFSWKIKDDTLKEMIKKKKEMGFETKSWEEWFNELFHKPEKRNTSNIIEEVFQKKNFEKWYDIWIKNFALNLEHIWNGNSAKEISNERITRKAKMSAIVIGRGPTLIEHNHLERLLKSNYCGAIVCCDGALKSVLKSGITPEKFENFFVVSVDAQDSIKDFYDDPLVGKYGDKIKAIFSTTISPLTLRNAKNNGLEIFWLHALFDYNRGKTSFNYIASLMTKTKKHTNGLPAIQTGGNVGTSGWVISWSILKCSPIALLGIDHAYPVNTSWETINAYHKLPDDIDKNSEIFKKAYPIIHNPDFNCDCIQDPVFQYYSNALKEFIPLAPNWVKTINATEGGAIFGRGIHSMSFKQFLETYRN